MNSPKPESPLISEIERTPLVDALLEIIAWQNDRIAGLEQQILKLKGETTKPEVKPSKMDKNQPSEADSDSNDGKEKPKPGPKCQKTATLRVDVTLEVEPDHLPDDAVFKGYREVVVQDLIIKSHNTCYRLAQYQLSDGSYVSGQLPEHLNGNHFGADLIRFIQHQYHHQHVTQPLIRENLLELGVAISAGQVNHFITEAIDIFHAEKDELLQAGLQASDYIHVDDTTAHHQGKNGYCTHIGNELFAWFGSTQSKSRINFLELLSQGSGRLYLINEGALAYMEKHKLPQFLLAKLETLEVKQTCAADWEQWLDEHGIIGKTHRRIATEGALMGGLLAQGIPVDFSIISDDAGQFNVFDHALCWIHSERGINRLIPMNALQKAAVDWARGEIWGIYADLKAYKLNPEPEQTVVIRQRFQALVDKHTDYATLNQVLKKMGENQYELLRVLDKPHLPLHNNLSESDIRDFVKKRKISGSTRSDAGRKARDTFASLKKTCRKHGISFWDYLKDRLLGEKQIPRLSDLIGNAATCG
jgi:hypothetical protein